MGAIAEHLAPHMVLIFDNPRNEGPQYILGGIADGMYNPRATTQIEDCVATILHAVRHVDVYDVIVMTGKGHESAQEIVSRKRPLSD